MNGVDISLDNDLFDIMDDGSLLITGLLVTECSQYVCTASNPLGQSSESVTICGEGELYGSQVLSKFNFTILFYSFQL